MVEYKLIKEYPGSPKLGTIIQKKLSSYEEVDVYRGFYTTIPSLIEKYPEFWEKVVEEPLFTTEDGVEIYEGDKYYAVNKYTLQLVNSHAYMTVNKWIIPNYSNGNWKLFSTEAAAEEYVFKNKRVLSYEDLKSLGGDLNNGAVVLKWKDLEKLVKSK
jgi:hypothetical protein